MLVAAGRVKNDHVPSVLHIQAEDILSSLRVDEDKLMQVVSMGFDVREARLGLRAASGNVSIAVTKITEQRERRKEIREKEAEERSKKAAAKKFGKTANGQWYVCSIHGSPLEYHRILGLNPT